MNCINGFTITAFLLAVALAAHVTTIECRPMTNERLGLPPATAIPTVRNVFSADFCGPCKKLRAKLERDGAKFSDVQTYDKPVVGSYPTVYYETAKGRLISDNGQRIHAGLYRLPDTPVTVVEWITKGK